MFTIVWVDGKGALRTVTYDTREEALTQYGQMRVFGAQVVVVRGPVEEH